MKKDSMTEITHKMKISMMSLMMGDMSPEKITACAMKCGMTGIDWITLHHSSAEHLKKISNDCGLQIAAYTPLDPSFTEGTSDGLDELKYSVENACILETPNLVIPPFPLAKQQSIEDGRRRWISFYETALPIVQNAGLNLCIESTGFLNSPIVSGQELLAVVTAVPDIKIAFDSGNTATADNMSSAFEMVKDYVVHFHLKDWKIFDAPAEGSDQKRTGKYYRDCVIGEGSLDVFSFLKNLVLPVYKGYFNLEASDPSGQRSPETVMQQVCCRLREHALF